MSARPELAATPPWATAARQALRIPALSHRQPASRGLLRSRVAVLFRLRSGWRGLLRSRVAVLFRLRSGWR
ncbi:hypothetical protein, partial [Actinoplanes utahensis]|uniref:hypothetical protein n=1 Tax=Actinoplanes utahensis TaxID=1869 RepID=UPI0031EFC8C6